MPSADKENVHPASLLNNWIQNAISEHQRIVEVTLPLAQCLATEAAEANACEPACVALREKAAAVATSIERLFEREHRMIYPMFRRLKDQSMVRPCQAGVVQAWIRQIVRLQNELSSEIAALQQLASQRVSPAGPCEICRTLAQVVTELAAVIDQQAESEQQGMFRRAIDYENELISRNADTGESAEPDKSIQQ